MFQFPRPSARSVAALIALLLLAAAPSIAQLDTLVLKNGDVIAGELKSLDVGVVTMETDYSKSDFTIEWDGVKKIHSRQRFLVTLRDGARYNGSVRSAGADTVIVSDSVDGISVATTLMDVVFLRAVETGFWSRLRANIDIGYSVTKANNLHQYSSKSSLGYLVDQWELTLSYNANQSNQDSVADIERTETGANFVYYLPSDFFLQASGSTLSNTEQALKMRAKGTLGGGRYLVHSNRSYVRTGAGLAYNDESYTNDTPDKSSIEAYFGVEVDLFDIGDLNLNTKLYAYPSLTESKRVRSDFNLDLKYDLLEDFYVKFSTTVYYDNRPAVVDGEFDYTYGFSVGWEME